MNSGALQPHRGQKLTKKIISTFRAITPTQQFDQPATKPVQNIPALKEVTN